MISTVIADKVADMRKEKFQKDQKQWMIAFGFWTIVFALASTYFWFTNNFEKLTLMSITFGISMFAMGLFYGFWMHKVMQEKYDGKKKDASN